MQMWEAMARGGKANTWLAKPRKISTPSQTFKNPIRNFFGINMSILLAKFQLSSLKTEVGVWGNGWATWANHPATLVKFLTLITHFACSWKINFKRNKNKKQISSEMPLPEESVSQMRDIV